MRVVTAWVALEASLLSIKTFASWNAIEDEFDAKLELVRSKFDPEVRIRGLDSSVFEAWRPSLCTTILIPFVRSWFATLWL